MVREETPDYKSVIGQVRGALETLEAVREFRYTVDESNAPYVNIKSLRSFFNEERLKEQGLVKWLLDIMSRLSS